MSLPHIKVCGITDMQQVAELAALGANYAGFIFYKKSPRYVGEKILPQQLQSFNQIKKAGVFVNASVDEILQTVAAYGLNAVQLHGDETPEFCVLLRAKLPVIKAFRVNGTEDLNVLTSPYNAVADYFLFDTKAKDYGGTGKKFNWSVFENYKPGKPFFLSGGIGPNDVDAITDFMQHQTLFAIDVNSKFETAPGIKDINLLKQFVGEMNRFDV